MIVFFDVDEITHNYLKDKAICDGGACMFEHNIASLSNEDIAKYQSAEIISVFINTRLTAETLAKFPNLKLVTTRSTGTNHIDIGYCDAHNIVVENVPRYGEATVAEFALGLCLNLTRKVNRAYQDLKNGICEIDKYMGRDLYKSTLGVIGTGAIGRHTVKIAQGLGMNILAYDLYPAEDLKANGVQYVELDELYAQSDFISLHCPLTKDNWHMIDKEAMAKMKDGVIIINTARGELINSEDLYAALKSGKVGAAGLDALEEEASIFNEDIYISRMNQFKQSELVTSFVNMKLLQLNNVIITPHIAFNSINAINRILDTTLHNIEMFQQGNIVNAVGKIK